MNVLLENYLPSLNRLVVQRLTLLIIAGLFSPLLRNMRILRLTIRGEELKETVHVIFVVVKDIAGHIYQGIEVAHGFSAVMKDFRGPETILGELHVGSLLHFALPEALFQEMLLRHILKIDHPSPYHGLSRRLSTVPIDCFRAAPARGYPLSILPGANSSGVIATSLNIYAEC